MFALFCVYLGAYIDQITTQD